MTEYPPFSEDDLNSAPAKRPKVYNPPKPENPLRDSRKSDDALAFEYAKANDLHEAYRHMVPPVREPQQRRSILGRVQPAQFATVPGLAEVHEQMRDNPPEGLKRVPRSSSVMDRPSQHITQDNWQKGMGETIVERNFSPRTRAQGHLLGAAAMFVAAYPPMLGRPRVDSIRY